MPTATAALWRLPPELGEKTELPRSPDWFSVLILYCDICEFQEPTSAFGIVVAGRWGG